MGVLSAEWQRSAVQTHQAYGTETPVQTQNIFPDEPARKVPDLAIQAGPALRLGPKLEYNCHGCSTWYTRLPLATGQSLRCSSLSCPLVQGRKRVLSLNSECAAGFCTQCTTCI